MPITADKRGYVAGKYGIELDGIMAGWIWSAEGGHATSDVVVEKLGPDHIQKKHIAGVKYEDITVQCGTGMSKAFYQWMKDSFDHKYTRKNGAIIAADYNYAEHSRLTFYNALITEIGFPALDASSKDAAKMSIKFGPEYTRTQTTTGGASVSGKYSIDAKVQKKWLPANFRLRIDGLDDSCQRVNKIEAITVKQKVVENPIGELRDYEKEPASMEIPNLVCTVTESHAEEFYQWHEDFVINGNCTEKHEKTFAIQYLDQSRKNVLMELELMRCGIFKLTPDKVEAGMEAIRKVKVEMYCEEIRVKANKFWA
jgi:phage tail-like protein